MSYLLALTLLLTPTYAIRFGSLNFLMVWVVFVWTVFAIRLTIRKEWVEFFRSILDVNKWNVLPVLVFLLSGTAALLINGLSREKAGQYVVLFAEPVGIFVIAQYILSREPGAKKIITAALYAFVALAGAYALLQYFTLIGLPAAYWGNSVEPKRALSFFAHPNFYALCIAPILAFLVPDVAVRLRDWKAAGAWLVGAAGLFFSLSRAGWFGLAAAVCLYVIIAGDKKIRKISLAAVIIMVMVVVSIPNFRYRLLLPFHGEKSAVSRLSLWDTGWKGVREAPLTGLGLTGFSSQWERLNTDPNLDSHNFPHNIFLNFWLETGLWGLASFLVLCGAIVMYGLHVFRLHPTERTLRFRLAVVLYITALFAQGLIDNPYFKNDLAMIFWIIMSFGIWYNTHNSKYE